MSEQTWRWTKTEEGRGLEAKHPGGITYHNAREVEWVLAEDYDRDTSALRAVVERYASKCGACGGKGFVKLTWSDACAPGFFGANTPSYEEWTACGGKFDCEHCADLRAALHSSPAGKEK